MGRTPPLMGQDKEEQRRRQRYGGQRGERKTGEVLGFARQGTRCSKSCCYCFFHLRRIGITAIPLDSARELPVVYLWSGSDRGRSQVARDEKENWRRALV